ncbi:MAG: AmmeMemoRadiSam system radical SAM enzyme, partial [Candidatus Pacearchaeota archaeon]|nr:AmmeMemoRadiSam system radical SAM enzyme [Candidatus Pacearchaeota archaeon]
MKEHEALFYKKLRNKIVQCNLCPKFCVIKEEEWGNCNARKNIQGKLYSMVYGKPVSVAIDPIEKKPLYHFLPSSKSLSIATAGCNFHCAMCQNWRISQSKPNEVPHLEATPQQIVEQAKSNNLKSISYTYTEPIVFYEYTFDIAKLAKKNRIKNVVISNGFINKLPLKKLLPLINAANIDLKGNSQFYEKICEGKLEPVLETLKMLYGKAWLEITNLIVPGFNDNVEEIKKIVSWILENLDNNVPLHFSAFFPCYKLIDVPPTQPEFLIKARIIARNMGLNYVYTGNIDDEEGSTTFCPKCGQA